jgi:hypothetical protein
MDPRAGLDYVEKKKFLTIPRLELLPLGRSARSQSLCRLRYSCYFWLLVYIYLISYWSPIIFLTITGFHSAKVTDAKMYLLLYLPVSGNQNNNCSCNVVCNIPM